MQWQWFEQYVGHENFDKAIAYLTYHVAVWTFFITIVVLLATILSIRTPLREASQARKAEANARIIEAEERRLERSVDLLRMLSGLDPKTGQKGTSTLQLAAIEILSSYPEYHRVYVELYEFWQAHPEQAGNHFIVLALNNLIAKTAPK